jgi:hypothetical protein
MTFSTFLLSVEVSSFSWPSPTRPVENVVVATKGLQERKIQLLNETMVKKVIKINYI